MTQHPWTPDDLGAPFEKLTLELGHDDEGEVVATLVRLQPERASWWRRLVGTDRRELDDVDVLYVHGWSDYFFQTRLAHFWTERGATFHALDLRKYGRSMRPGQTPGYVSDLEVYDEDIAAALAAMGWSVDAARPGRRLVLIGHSTGGLVLSLWAARHPNIATALVLNSPWLSIQLPAITRAAASRIIQFSARLAPMDVGPQLDLGYYARAVTEAADEADPVQINREWRPEISFPVHTGWLHAVIKGQTRVESGLGLTLPVNVLLSTRSTLPTRWSDALTESDSVLIVDDIAQQSLRLGASVRVERVEGALHDVFLSRREAREDAYARLADIARTLPPAAR